MNHNPRATNYISTTKQENNAIHIMDEIRTMHSPTLHFLLCKFIECPILKNQPEFMQTIFNGHLGLVIEMFEWMLTPKFIARRKKIKSNLDFFPYRVKEFIKDNIYFYEQLYISIHNGKLPFSLCFNFLRAEFFDKETTDTALGYFAQVMVPFAKYQFSESLNITQSLELSTKTEDEGVETLSIMKILPKPLIDELLDHAHYEPIYQFIKTAVLVSIEEAQYYQISKSTMVKLLENSQVPNIFAQFPLLTPESNANVSRQIDLLENVTLSFKEVIVNIEPGNDVQLRIQSFIQIIVESKIIPYAVTQIVDSSYCNPPASKLMSSTPRFDLFSSQEIQSPRLPFGKSQLSLSQGNLPSPKNNNNLQSFEQDLVQILLKLLTFSIQIFVRIPKIVPVFVNSQQRIGSTYSIRQTTPQSYKLLLVDFREEMQFVLNNLQKVSKLAWNEAQSMITSKSIPFSSGQKIKPITFMKYQFLKLIHNCLIMLQCSENLESKMEKLKINDKPIITINSKIPKSEPIAILPFEIDLEKLHIVEILQKCLSENRWNNVVHHVVQKICHLLVLCSYDYLSKKIEKDKKKKITEGFLAFLIQNFTQRDYIFLDTFRFTSQGNLQSIYNISKDLAYTMNNTNQLVILLNDFEAWKKFLMNDLKLYEEKTYPKNTLPEVDKEDEDSSNEVLGLKVDEVDSIQKLIENISTTKKWPTKISKNKGNYKSGIIRNSDEKHSGDESEPMTRSQGFYLRPKKQQGLKKTLDDLLKKKVEESKEYDEREIQELNINDISVREQILKANKSKSQIIEPTDHREDERHEVFKKYAQNRTKKDDKSS